MLKIHHTDFVQQRLTISHSLILGKNGGAGVLVEKQMGKKVPGVGCQLHVIERLEDCMMRVAHGKTTSPEEGVSVKLKAWMNGNAEKNHHDVKKEFDISCLSNLS